MVTVRLLGPPSVERDGVAARSPRGRKTWALLAYLVLAERPVARSRLAELLFADADDPMGALRWTLAEVRRALGRSDLLGGDPVAPPGPEVAVDVRVLADADADPAGLLGAGTLLEGVALPSCVEFEAWLLVERRRISAAVEARLRQRAAVLLASGRAADAVPYAAAVVARAPLEESNHELLVRSLALAGDPRAARRQVAVAEDLLRRELSVTASAALHEAATVTAGSTMVPPVAGRSAAVSQLDAGRAALAAGAVDAGIQCLRRAVAEAAACGDTALRARALAALGGALVHAVRGRDEEGTVVLHEAVELATRAGDQATTVTAYRELGYVDVQAGRRRTADAWLARARALAGTDAELAAIAGVRGQNASDRADYPLALALLAESVELADRAGDERQQAWSLSILARAHLLRGEHSQAAAALAGSLDLVARQRWLAFLPWPQSLRAELDLAAGDLDGAAERLTHAWALACQIGDPCWEGIAARGLGLLHAGRGDRAGATGWLDEATTRCNRVSDRYQWIHGHVLDAAAGAAIDRGDPARARALVGALSTLAARCDMPELVVRGHLHRHRLGEPAALPAARMLAADIDNPSLTQLLERA